jgi:hypothetical protein
MNEYIYKSFSDKFESQKLRHDLLSDIRYPNDINYAVRDPTNKMNMLNYDMFKTYMIILKETPI